MEHNKVVPLYCEAYSSDEAGYTNNSDKVIKIIETVISYIQKQLVPGLLIEWAITMKSLIILLNENYGLLHG